LFHLRNKIFIQVFSLPQSSSEKLSEAPQKKGQKKEKGEMGEHSWPKFKPGSFNEPPQGSVKKKQE